MKKSLGVKPYLYPMPVLMISTYNDDGSVDVMNMAWGGMCAQNLVALNLGESHKTSDNLKKRMAFTISIADAAHIEAADFFGMASSNNMPDKFARSGLHAVKSDKVDAPIVEEFPVTLECKVIEIRNANGDFRVVGEILNVLADEKVLDADGKIDPKLVGGFVYDQFQGGYYAVGEKIGQAWKTGAGLMK